jgi:hypothetical protein
MGVIFLSEVWPAAPQELKALTARMEGLEQRLATSGPKPAPHTQPTRPTESSSERSELPAGLVVTATFAKEHGISESGTKKALASGRIPRAPGGLWKVGRVWVKDMLDQEGRRAFLEAYHSSEHFHHCTDPACLCHQYTAGDNAATLTQAPPEPIGGHTRLW